MVRFGRNYILLKNLNFFGRVGYYLFGNPNIGSFIRFLYFKKVLKQVRWMCALDAACGNGEFAFYLAEKYPWRYIHAFDIGDISPNKKIQEKLTLKNLNFFKNSLLKFNIRNRYNFVYLVGSLIYFSSKENKKILKNMFKALKLGGFFYFEAPQKNWHEFSLLNRKIYQKQYELHKKENLSSYLYSKEELEMLFKKLGFKIIYIKKTFGYFGKLAWEIDQILQEYNFYTLKTLLIPGLKILGILDANIHNRKGGGLAVLAYK